MAHATPLRQVIDVNKEAGKKVVQKYVYAIQEPEEIATEMLWLGSYCASFINGEIFVIDSGLGVTSADYDYWLKRQTKVELLEAQKVDI